MINVLCEYTSTPGSPYICNYFISTAFLVLLKSQYVRSCLFKWGKWAGLVVVGGCYPQAPSSCLKWTEGQNALVTGYWLLRSRQILKWQLLRRQMKMWPRPCKISKYINKFIKEFITNITNNKQFPRVGNCTMELQVKNNIIICLYCRVARIVLVLPRRMTNLQTQLGTNQSRTNFLNNCISTCLDSSLLPPLVLY